MISCLNGVWTFRVYELLYKCSAARIISSLSLILLPVWFFRVDICFLWWFFLRLLKSIFFRMVFYCVFIMLIQIVLYHLACFAKTFSFVNSCHAFPILFFVITLSLHVFFFPGLYSLWMLVLGWFSRWSFWFQFCPFPFQFFLYMFLNFLWTLSNLKLVLYVWMLCYQNNFGFNQSVIFIDIATTVTFFSTDLLL